MRELSIFSIQMFFRMHTLLGFSPLTILPPRLPNEEKIKICESVTEKFLTVGKAVKSFYVVWNEMTNIRLESSGLENPKFVDYLR